MSSKRTTHDVFKKKLLSHPDVRKYYDNLEGEFALIQEMLRVRQAANMTQADLAKKMKTTKSVISRLESFNRRSSPTIDTLKKYAQAVGCELSIHFIDQKNNK